MAPALLLLVAPCAACAATQDKVSESLALAAIDRDKLNTAAARGALASAAKSYCDAVRGAYPQNSPAEDGWIDGEVHAGGDRMMRAAGSAEWGRRQAKIFTDQCALWIAEYEKTPDKSRTYVGLAYTFLRFSGDAEAYAAKNNVDTVQWGFPVVPRLATEGLLIAALLASR